MRERERDRQTDRKREREITYMIQTPGTLLYMTSLNPQKLRNIIKRVAKISIIQILMSNLSVKATAFCYFLQPFRYPTNFARLR